MKSCGRKTEASVLRASKGLRRVQLLMRTTAVLLYRPSKNLVGGELSMSVANKVGKACL